MKKIFTNHKLEYMKKYNEYNDKLISVKTATLAKQNGYDIYNPECFATSEELDRTKEMIIDEWSGMVAEGYNFFCYRPTQSSLKKWLRDEKNIQIYLKPTENKKWSVYVDQWGCQKGTDYIIKDNYEDALEKGLLIGLKKINENEK